MALFFTALFFMLGVGWFLAGMIAVFHLNLIVGAAFMAIGFGFCYLVVFLTS